MLEVFFFQKRDNLEDKINQVKQELYYGDSDSDEDEEIPENTIVENNEFIESNCNVHYVLVLIIFTQDGGKIDT